MASGRKFDSCGQKMVFFDSRTVVSVIRCFRFCKRSPRLPAKHPFACRDVVPLVFWARTGGRCFVVANSIQLLQTGQAQGDIFSPLPAATSRPGEAIKGSSIGPFSGTTHHPGRTTAQILVSAVCRSDPGWDRDCFRQCRTVAFPHAHPQEICRARF